jgi:hypothetical protein
MQRFPRRIRVPSRKAQEANQTFEIYEDLEARVERLRNVRCAIIPHPPQFPTPFVGDPIIAKASKFG